VGVSDTNPNTTTDANPSADETDPYTNTDVNASDVYWGKREPLGI
jgi:hypothetical protein